MRNNFLLFTVLFVAVSFSVFAQDNRSDESLMTVEEAYLNSIEGVIIKEMVSSEGRDTKLVALQYIQDAIEKGKVSPDVERALDSLATVGLSTVVYENGRSMNNYPDIRIKACELLGKMGTKEAMKTLVRVMYADNEPSVVTAAVHSVGELGFNDGDEAVDMINWINRKFDIINPTSSLALEILNTYEKIASKVQNKKPMVEGIMRIASNYSYVTPVREKALVLLKTVTGVNTK
ncbi:MAG: HEAT repeat domain-containing protein [Treponema sp.]